MTIRQTVPAIEPMPSDRAARVVALRRARARRRRCRRRCRRRYCLRNRNCNVADYAEADKERRRLPAAAAAWMLFAIRRRCADLLEAERRKSHRCCYRVFRRSRTADRRLRGCVASLIQAIEFAASVFRRSTWFRCRFRRARDATFIYGDDAKAIWSSRSRVVLEIDGNDVASNGGATRRLMTAQAGGSHGFMGNSDS